jgi:hypothetical protein
MWGTKVLFWNAASDRGGPIQLSGHLISVRAFLSVTCPSPSPLRHGAQVRVASVGGCRGPNSQS